MLIAVLIAFLVGTNPDNVTKFFKTVKNKILKLFGLLNTTKNNYTEQDAKSAIDAVKSLYGLDLARTVEKMFRLETRHFKSEQYRLTGTPGMEVGKWPANEVPTDLPTIKMHDADKSDGIDEFIVWNPKDCALFLARYIRRHSGNWARWNSTDAAKQSVYRLKVNEIKNRFV